MKRLLAVVLFVVMLAAYTVAFAETAGEKDPKEPQIFEWGDLGRVQLIRVSDCPEELMDPMYKPKGRLVVMVFSILDDAEMPTNAAFDFAAANVALDEFELYTMIGQGVMIIPDGDSFIGAVVGNIVIYYDVPVDYDLSQAHIIVCGEEAVIPDLPEPEAE